MSEVNFTMNDSVTYSLFCHILKLKLTLRHKFKTQNALAAPSNENYPSLNFAIKFCEFEQIMPTHRFLMFVPLAVSVVV